MVILLYLYYHSSIILIFLSILITYISIALYPITTFIITIFIYLGTYSSTRKSTGYYLASLSPFIVFFHVFRSQKVTKRLHRIKLDLFRVPAGMHYMVVLWILFLYFLIYLHLGLLSSVCLDLKHSLREV